MTPPSSTTDRDRLLSWIDAYREAQNAALTAVDPGAIADIVDLLKRAVGEGRRIFVCGNGGNAANAAHFTTDLGKGASAMVPRPFRVLCIADNTAWMTAIGNDFSFDDVFVRQLANHAEPGDVLILSSVSGSSPNLAAAIRWAKEHGLVSVALVGSRRGSIAPLADHLVVVPDTHYGRVEDVQMNVLHMLCYAFMEQAVTGEG